MGKRLLFSAGAMVAALLSINLVQAQVQAPGLVWQRCLGGSSTEFPYGVQPTSDGGTVMAGFTLSTDGDVSGNYGSRDFWLTKVDVNGDLLWQHCYGGTGTESANGLVTLAGGGLLAFGNSSSSDGDVTCDTESDGKAWVLKTDEDGNLQWQVCLGVNGGSTPWAAASASDGGVLIVGTTFATEELGLGNHGLSDFFAAKLDEGGDLIWSRCYGGSGYDEAYAVRQTTDGGYVLAGNSGSSDGQVMTGDQDGIWVIKIDPEGELVWDRKMGSMGVQGIGEELRDVVQTEDGGYMVVANSNGNDGDVSGNHGDWDGWLVRLDENGVILQSDCFGGSDEDYVRKVFPVGMDQYVLAGYSRSYDGDVTGNHGSADVWVFMVNSDLGLQWQKCLGGTDTDLGHVITQGVDGALVVAARTQSNDGDVSGNHGGEWDTWLAKLDKDSLSGIAEVIDHGRLYTYPSPTRDILQIRLPEHLASNSVLEVLDITGRTVLHEAVDGNTPQLQLDVQGLAQGSYCIRLSAGSAVFASRFVKR